MASTTYNSAIANAVAQRTKLSAIRQRIGLENNQGSMREIAPSPANGPAMKKGDAMAAMDDLDYENWQHNPEKEQEMLSRIQGWIDENNNGIDDRSEPMPEGQDTGGEPATPANQPKPETSPPKQDPAVEKALSPISAYYKEHGRIPNQEDLKKITVERELKDRLGREPTAVEIELYLAKPGQKKA